MTYDLVKNLMKYTILIALVGFVLSWAFGFNKMYIETRSYNGIQFLYFNWNAYSQNISKAWDTSALKFETLIPADTWDDTGTWYNWEPFFNNLKYIFNWFIFIPNLLAWPIRWIAWLAQLTLTLIGWDTTINLTTGLYNSFTMQVLQWIPKNLIIPYLS